MRRVLAALFVLLTVAVLWVLLRPIPDPPPPPPGPRVALTAPDEEAWLIWRRALKQADQIVQRDDGIWAAVRAAVDPQGPPLPEALEVWRAFEGAFDAMDQALARPGLTLPVHTDSSTLNPARILVPARCVRGWQRALAGDPAAGAQDMLAAYTLASRLQDAAEGMTVVSEATLDRAVALRELGELLDHTRESEAHALALAELIRVAPRAGATLRVLPGQCRSEVRDALASVHSVGNLTVLGSLGVHKTVRRVGIPVALAETAARQVVYDPNDLVQTFQRRCEQVEADLRTPPAARAPLPSMPTQGWLTGDPVGSRLARRMDYFTSIAAREEQVDAAHGVLVVLSAARLALYEEGRLVERAAELVPSRLSVVPNDPYSEYRIRLSEGKVWSEGSAWKGMPRLVWAVD